VVGPNDDATLYWTRAVLPNYFRPSRWRHFCRGRYQVAVGSCLFEIGKSNFAWEFFLAKFFEATFKT
jgi:hypothetical protein